MIYGALGSLAAIAGGSFSTRQLYLQSLPADEAPACDLLTPAVLPLKATFYNRYLKYETVRNVAGKGHPITYDLTDEQMPYTTDQFFALDDQHISAA